MSNQEKIPQKHISSLTASNPSQKQSSNSNNSKKNLKRFKSHLTYFSPKADSQRKTKIFLNDTKMNKKIEIQLDNDENIQKLTGSPEKISHNQFSSSYSVEIGKNQFAKLSNSINKSKKINTSNPNSSKTKTDFSTNNIHSNKLQKKTARFEKILQEDSIQELANEENDENNQLQNNNNINNKKILNVSKLELDNNININLIDTKKSNESIKNDDNDLNKSLLKNCKKGDKERVFEILANKDKININYQNENGWTALHFACDEGNLKIVEILIKAHAELNLINNEKKTPLHISVSHGYFDISKLLIENNANLDCVDNEKNLAIHLCALHGHNELLTYMLEKKSSYINEQNLYGNTVYDLAKDVNTKKIIEKYINKEKEIAKKESLNFSNKKIKTKVIQNKSNNFINKNDKGFCKIVIHKTNKNQIKALMSPLNNNGITNMKANNIVINKTNNNKNNEYNNINVLHNNIPHWNNKFNNYINVNNKNNNLNYNKNNSINNSNTNNNNGNNSNMNNSIGNINNNINATPTKNNNNLNNVIKRNELPKKDIIKCNINPNTTKKIKKSSKCFNNFNNEENNSKSSMKLKLINLNNLNNNCSDSTESSKNFNNNYYSNNSNNLYYNTNSHIKAKSRKKYQIETNITSNLNINSKEFKSPFNSKKSNEYFHPTTEKKSLKTFKIPKYDINISTNNNNSLYKDYPNSNSKINTYMNIRNKINKSKNKIKTEGNNKSPNKFIVCNLGNNNKIKKTQFIINKENKKNSKIKFSKRTVSLPGFLNNSKNNTSEISEKNKNKTNTIKHNQEKLNVNKIKNKSKKNMNLPKTYSNIRDNNINYNSIKPGNSNKDLVLNKHNKFLTNQNLNFNDKNMVLKINNTDSKDNEIKFEQICTDEDNNLIEDLEEEEEIIVNLKKKEKSSKIDNNKSTNDSKIDSNTIKNDKNYTNSKSENKLSTQKNTVNTQIEDLENFNNNSINETNENANIDSYSDSENENDENSKNNIEKIGPGDFICLALLGQGSFGEVYLVKKKDVDEYYAMKVLDKKKIKKQNIFKYAMTERNVLSILNYPFIVKLNYAFQTNEKLFLLLDYCPGGDLSKQLSLQTRFSEDKAKFYICEIILALGELHKHDIIFRDLKPDNIIIDKQGHAMLTDFGLSREGINDKQIAKSFCGSIAYLAPEMLKRTGHGKSVDWYLLGVVFFEMLVGIPPYFSNSQEQIFKNIEKAELYIPNFISKNAQKLIRELLKRNPAERLGSKNDVDDIKNHVYFEDVDWEKVYKKEYIPPPIIHDENSVKFFGYPKFFGNNESVVNNNDLYEGWSFVNNNIKKGVENKNDEK